MYNQENNNFFGYYGYIGRKNYIINSVILAVMFVVLHFVNFPSLMQYSNMSFLNYVLEFIIGCFKFITIFSFISLAYRRLEHITAGKSNNLALILKRIYGILYVYPILAYCLGPFLDFIPGLNIAMLWSIIIILPFTLLFTIVISFIKGNN